MGQASEHLLEQLPHRGSFLFLSGVLELYPGASAVGLWKIAGDEWFLPGHFPGEPVVPGVLLAESLAQLAGLIGVPAATESPQRMQLAHVDVKFRASITPPAEVLLRARLVRTLGPLHLFAVVAEHNGGTAAEGMVSLAAVSHPEGSPA